jgi:predicted nucleic acid-binding Zn ribbon protein
LETTVNNFSRGRGVRRGRGSRAAAIRRRLIEEWRGLPEGPGPDPAVPFHEALKTAVAKLGLSECLCEEQVRDAWHGIVGEFLASHSAPSSMRSGVLTIDVFQPSVRFELEREWKPEILKKLRARFGAEVIRDIRFR